MTTPDTIDLDGGPDLRHRIDLGFCRGAPHAPGLEVSDDGRLEAPELKWRSSGPDHRDPEWPGTLQSYYTRPAVTLHAYQVVSVRAQGPGVLVGLRGGGSVLLWADTGAFAEAWARALERGGIVGPGDGPPAPSSAERGQ